MNRLSKYTAAALAAALLGVGASTSRATVIQQDSPDQYHVVENAPTHFGGHSLVVDPATHRVYVAYFGSIAAYDPLR